MRAFFSALSVGLALMVMATSASAVPFSYRFESQISGIDPSGTFAEAGDPASITVTLDNGETNDLSQVWTADHLQSVTFDINNGAATVSFFSPFDGGLADAVGVFSTDDTGTLISVPSNWRDGSATVDFTASFLFDTDLSWFINGENEVLFDDSLSVALSLADVQGVLDPANWSRVTATAIPLPPTLLLLLVGLGGMALLRRGSPATTGAFAEARGA